MQIERGDRYSRGAIAFHWVIAALVLFNLWLGIFHDSLPREWKVMPVHKSVGITILALTLGNAPGQRMLSVQLGSQHYVVLLLGLVLIAMAMVMREAQRMAQENAEFV